MDSIIYQIYPLSFQDSNNDGYGDLQGIIEKIDYLKELGINTIWLSPIFKSPMKDFGYDIEDFYSIDPLFGSMQDFEILIQKFHQKKIKIILDYVFNHTSDQHPWFLESKSSKVNPKRNWYIWKKGKGKNQPPNNWISAFGGSSWEYDINTDEWYLHDFLKEQPDLNWRNPEVKKAMFDVLKFWFKKEVDGFRLDATAFLFEDPDFPDNPKSLHFNPQTQTPWDSLKRKYDFNQPEVTKIIHEITDLVSQYGDKLLLDEIYTDFSQLKNLYFRKKNTFHIPFNFDLMFLPWDVNKIAEFLIQYDRAVGKDNLPNYVLGNHDQPRIGSRIDKEKSKLLAMLQLTLRGIPIIYYGEEIGMENRPFKSEEIKDPLGIKVGKYFSRDPQRTPMQWSSELNSGFTNGNPWLPINDNYLKINVESEKQQPNSLFNMYHNLIKIRKDYNDIINSMMTVEVINNKLLLIKRSFKKQSLLLVLNFTDENISYKTTQSYQVIFSTNLSKTQEQTLNLKPYEGVILKLFN